MTLRPQTVVRRATRLLHTELGDNIMILDVDDDMYYEFNEFGARMYALAERQVTLSRMVEQLVDEFDVDRDRCWTAVREFASELVVEGVFEIIQTLPGHLVTPTGAGEA